MLVYKTKSLVISMMSVDRKVICTRFGGQKSYCPANQINIPSIISNLNVSVYYAGS